MALTRVLERWVVLRGGENEGDDSDGGGGNPTTGDSDDGRQY